MYGPGCGSRFRSKYLNGEYPLIVGTLQELQGLHVVPDNPLGGDHLRVAEIGAPFEADRPKGCIGVSGHGCQKEVARDGESGKFDCPKKGYQLFPDFEEGDTVLVDGFCKLLYGHLPHFGYKSRRFFQVGGLVSFPSVGGGNHKWRLAFDEHPLQGHLFGRFVQVSGVTVGDVPRKGDV